MRYRRDEKKRLISCAWRRARRPAASPGEAAKRGKDLNPRTSLVRRVRARGRKVDLRRIRCVLNIYSRKSIFPAKRRRLCARWSAQGLQQSLPAATGRVRSGTSQVFRQGCDWAQSTEYGSGASLCSRDGDLCRAREFLRWPPWFRRAVHEWGPRDRAYGDLRARARANSRRFRFPRRATRGARHALSRWPARPRPQRPLPMPNI